MTEITHCASLAEVRQNIDRLDRQLVTLIAERGQYVKHAAGLKKSAEEVPAPQRFAEVLAKVDALARQTGADPSVIEATWRAMIGAFIEAERQLQARLHPPSPSTSPTPH